MSSIRNVMRIIGAMGRGDRERGCHIFTVTMFFAFLAGMILTAGGLLFIPQIADVLGAKGVLKELTTQYLHGYFLGALPGIMMTAMMGVVRIDGSFRFPILCIIVIHGTLQRI